MPPSTVVYLNYRVLEDHGWEVDDDDLSAIRFDMSVEADIGGDEDTLVETGEEICHVHSALRDDLAADISVAGDAF